MKKIRKIRILDHVTVMHQSTYFVLEPNLVGFLQEYYSDLAAAQASWSTPTMNF